MRDTKSVEKNADTMQKKENQTAAEGGREGEAAMVEVVVACYVGNLQRDIARQQLRRDAIALDITRK